MRTYTGTSHPPNPVCPVAFTLRSKSLLRLSCSKAAGHIAGVAVACVCVWAAKIATSGFTLAGRAEASAPATTHAFRQAVTAVLHVTRSAPPGWLPVAIAHRRIPPQTRFSKLEKAIQCSLFSTLKRIIPARDPKQCVCVRPRGVAAESLEIYTHWVVVMKVEIVVMVAVVVSVSVSVSESESASESESECVSASVRVKVSLSESKSESAQNLHFEVHQELRLPRNQFAKCCTGHEICTSRFTECSACHEVCTSRLQSAPPATQSALPGSQSAAPTTKSAIEPRPKVPIHCTCHEIRAPRPSPPCPKRCAFPCACHEKCPPHHARKSARRHNESAVARTPAADTQILRACAVEMHVADFERHECTVT